MFIADYLTSGIKKRLAVGPDGGEPMTGTRQYGEGTRYTLDGTSRQSAEIQAKEILVYPTKSAFVRNGADPTAVVDGDSIPCDAGAFHMRINKGEKLAFIKGSADDGFIYIVPVI